MEQEKILTVEEFEALPRKEKRILVAEDVIANLKARKFVASTGTYIASFMWNNDIDKSCDVRSNFDKINNCRVCALGACLLSTTKFKNKLTFRDVSAPTASNKSFLLISELFTPQELYFIEDCFEGKDGSRVAEDSFNWYLVTDKLFLSHKIAMKFKYKHFMAKDKLIALMNLVIENDEVTLEVLEQYVSDVDDWDIKEWNNDDDDDDDDFWSEDELDDDPDEVDLEKF